MEVTAQRAMEIQLNSGWGAVLHVVQVVLLCGHTMARWHRGTAACGSQQWGGEEQLVGPGTGSSGRRKGFCSTTAGRTQSRDNKGFQS